MTRLSPSDLTIAVLAVGCTALPAHAQRQRTDIAPYIEVGQVLTSDLQGDDVLTYTTVSAGVDVSARSRRVEVQLSYRYEHRFSYDKTIGDDSIHSGLARAAVAIAPGFSVEAGGIATRARSDIRGDAATSLAGNVRNVSQVYSAYVGPSLSTTAGPLNINAGYRFGYTKAEAPGARGVDPAAPPLDVYDSSKVHAATAAIGVKSGTVLPVGVTLSGAYTRETGGQLEQKYEGTFGRGDVVLPIGRSVAVAGGVGYEKIRVTQGEPLRDANGVPITDANGRFVTDPTQAPRIAYDIEGVFWDAGVIYRPSRRTTLEARAGRRYGSMSYTGSLSYQTGRGSAVQIGVYDSVTTFAQQLNGGIAGLPTSFVTVRDPFGNQINGCVFGTVGASAGGCLNGAFQSVSTSVFRSRGVDGVFVVNRGNSTMGLGAGYANRRFYSTDNGADYTIDGATDQSFYGQLFASQALPGDASLGGNLFVSYFDSDVPGTDGILSWGGNATYGRRWGRLGAHASAGLYGYDSETSDAEVVAQLLIGLRYGF